MSAEDLIPHHFKPGESGNPAGRPLGAKDGIRARARRMLRAKLTDKQVEELKSNDIELVENTHQELIVLRQVVKADEGDLSSAKYLTELTEEPLPKAVVLEGTLQVTKVERTIIDPDSRD